MKGGLRRLALRVGRPLKAAADGVVGWVSVGLLHAIRLMNRKRMADIGGFLTRTVGPWLKEHRIGRANLAAAFPQMRPDEIETILSGVWDNLGRVGAEFPHIDRLHIRDPERPGPEDITYDPATWERFHRLRLDGKPALIFASHLANWELSALIAAYYKLETSVLYRRPNIGAISDAIIKMRAGSMGTLVPAGLDTPVRLLRTLENNGHVAMLVDQHFIKGVDVTFFGQPCKANPLIAQLARHVECPIHGTRIVRLGDKHRFHAEMTEAIEPARDTEGRIDVQGTMQVITSVVEGWVREHPEQWLWLHRRWR